MQTYLSYDPTRCNRPELFSSVFSGLRPDTGSDYLWLDHAGRESLPAEGSKTIVYMQRGEGNNHFSQIPI